MNPLMQHVIVSLELQAAQEIVAQAQREDWIRIVVWTMVNSVLFIWQRARRTTRTAEPTVETLPTYACYEYAYQQEERHCA